jgi:hypothetical protein
VSSRELRVLYRLASTPESERRLVTLIDAAVDREANAFVLALNVPGFDQLSNVLLTRNKYGWLSDMKDTGKRVALWRGALRLIEGLAHVHRFRSVHRAVRPENVFLDVQRGPESLRLGGFEWSVRLGELVKDQPRQGTPLERANASLNADWRDVGLVLAGLFGVSMDAIASDNTERVIRALQELQRLTEDEKGYLRSLVSANGHGPLDRDDMVYGCREIIAFLERPARLSASDRLGVVVSLGSNLRASELAVRIAETDPSVTATDDSALRRWIEDDLSAAEIVGSGDTENMSYFLKGRRLPYRLVPFKQQRPGGDSELTWNLGYLVRAEYIDERRVTKRSLPAPGMIRVYTLRDANASYSEVRQRVRPWGSVLPTPLDPSGESHAHMSFLRRFLQVTNEIERAIRKTEIYPVRLIRCYVENGHEYAIVEERERAEMLPMFDRATPMVAYLSDEDAKAQAATEIYFGPESELYIDRWVGPGEFWTLHELPPGTRNELGSKQVRLRRFAHPGSKSPPPPTDAGFLRTRGMFAQLMLVDRREDAIDLLTTHTFLQRAIVLPDTVYMDTGVEDLPLSLPDKSKFDKAKRDTLKQIWRTRPIYYLQGPPGTGKTTLVGQLLRQIFEDDPACQVLLTAQAHSAVDHLRDEVWKFVEARKNEHPQWIAPLAVRLRKPKPDEIAQEVQDPAYPSSVAREILDCSIRILESRPSSPEYIEEWMAYARRPSEDGDFEQLVRRSANFVYCTSTAADLLELAQSHQTFDWSIIEEAGKAHGFDLALPLQTGHRWLLIGDQNQLPPYRDKDFARGLDRLDDICRRSNPDLRRFWDELSQNERQRFIDDSKRWLFFFSELFETAKARIYSETPLVGMLTEQHRMHPHIGDMISHAFYGEKIKNGTEDLSTGKPIDRVLHQFAGPRSVISRAILWLDVSQTPSGWHRADEGLHLNRREVDAIGQILAALQSATGRSETLAILTPYRRQMRELRSRLQRRPGWATLPEGYRHLDQDRVGVFTVDSFQGRQASVVAVSLVRNNTLREIGAAFGFLREHERINVMMSRAERLLVLVGNWEFFKAHLSVQSREDGQPFAELARLIDWLERAFEDGRARLIPANQFVEESAS